MTTTQQPRITLEILSGAISNVSATSITLNVLDNPGDREKMAATGVLAAAMGLSGPAAAMATFSSDEMIETAAKVTFELNGVGVTAVLAAWPFSEGDTLKLVGTRRSDGSFFALAVLDEGKRIIALCPHVSAGGSAHWAGVLRYSLWVGVPYATVVIAAFCAGIYALDYSFAGTLKPLATFYLMNVSIVIFIGYRIGRRFKKFIRTAESIFSALGWPDVKWVNLRNDVAARRQPGDPPQMGDTYFRY